MEVNEENNADDYGKEEAKQCEEGDKTCTYDEKVRDKKYFPARSELRISDFYIVVLFDLLNTFKDVEKSTQEKNGRNNRNGEINSAMEVNDGSKSEEINSVEHSEINEGNERKSICGFEAVAVLIKGFCTFSN